MQRRRLLATATLTALLLSIGTLPTAPAGTAAEPASHTQPAAPHAPWTADGPAAPQWGAAFGFDTEESFWWSVAGAIVCSFFTGPGGIACGVAGAA